MHGGWRAAVEVQDNVDGDWLTRTHVASCCIGILGAQEVLYLLAFRDNDGQLLDGQRSYQLRFPPGGLPQVDAFWSLTLYSKSDCLFDDNPMQRYAIGDRTQGLANDDDGGLTLHFGHHPPALISNWLTVSAAPFYLALRLYLPGQVHQQHQYNYPAIEATGPKT